MAIWFILILGAYLLGSVPTSYLAAKWFRGVDLRQYGTSQVGGGNLWRMTSWRLGLPVGLFDLSKGLVMVLVAQSVGLGIAQQIIVGSAAIIGHNWPIFLRFHGGRGVGTTIGVVFILPFINDMTPWVTVTFLAILIIGMVIIRSSPLPVLMGVVALPLASWFQEPLSVTLSFLVIFLIIVIKRLTAQPPVSDVSKRELWLNRLLFDRDIRDGKAWMYRVPGSTERPFGQQGKGKT